ncbi:MAG: tetratricopeptide repeat protein [Pseudomonadota bacterium]
MPQDSFGLELTTVSDDAARAWDRAVTESLEHRLSASERVKEALDADPDCVMALMFRGAMMLMIGTNKVQGKVADVAAHAKRVSGVATRREQMHVAALEHWLDGETDKARAVWREIVDEWPNDLVALRMHHHGSFWSGDREQLLAGPLGAYQALGDGAPGINYVKGMLAFGHEENGDYAQAEKFGREAMEANENDLWSLHAVAHVLEMQCRHSEGRDLLNYPFGTWDDRTPFKDHLWWHSALFALEEGDIARVLELYDREVRVDENGFYLDVQNAASLLERLELLGVDVGTRWDELADLAESRAGDHVMPFTDVHFMLALVGAKRLDAAKSYLGSLKAFARDGGNDAARVTGDVAVPLCEGLLAYGEGRYEDAADMLCAFDHDLSPLGASHAQRDIFQQLKIDAVMRAGRTGLARDLLEARDGARPGSDWARNRLKSLSR